MDFIKKYNRPPTARNYHNTLSTLSIITNLPVNRNSSLASSKIDRISFAVVIVGLTSLEMASAREMRALAIVVLPHLEASHKLKIITKKRFAHAHPGGPQRMTFSVVIGASESSLMSASGPVVR